MEQLRKDGFEVVEQFYEPDELGAALRDFDAVIIRSATKIKEPQIDAAKDSRLKLIIRAGVGVDNIAVHTWNVGDNVMGGKTLVMDNVIMVANFTNATVSTTVNVPVAGEWTNLMTDQKMSLSGSYTATLAANDYIIFVR